MVGGPSGVRERLIVGIMSLDWELKSEKYMLSHVKTVRNALKSFLDGRH